MKIALFTSNQPRHQHLINQLAKISDSLSVVSEVTTIFPGITQDFYNSSEVMQSYFTKMRMSEEKVFGRPQFLNKNVSVFPIKMGDLNSVPMECFNAVQEADYVIVFGASWIKGSLCELLIAKKAVNIHMGVSPYYRGAACNFWAQYDKNPEYVGATLHYLSKGLDSGKMIAHVFPEPQLVSGMDLGMLSVKAAHLALLDLISSNSLLKYPGVEQDKSKQIRYSKRSEFTDEVAADYLKNEPDSRLIFEKCSQRNASAFVNSLIF